MRSGNKECIRDAILVLGKRLQNNALTAEGRSRVEALPAFLARFNPATSVLVFCGGVTKGQTLSEASAMYQYYQQLNTHSSQSSYKTLLEDQSLNTIENIHNAAHKLISSGLLQQEQRVNAVFVSNDYHLQRIFQIQELMDEQGLLRVLLEKCQQAGLYVSISTDVQHHCSVPYPHANQAGQIFLALDELTVFRVFLEGVVRGVYFPIQRGLLHQVTQTAQRSMSVLTALVQEPKLVKRIEVLKKVIESVDETCSQQSVAGYLEQFHDELTTLNRQLDPEVVTQAH